jgi:hypothetical protein
MRPPVSAKVKQQSSSISRVGQPQNSIVRRWSDAFFVLGTATNSPLSCVHCQPSVHPDSKEQRRFAAFLQPVRVAINNQDALDALASRPLQAVVETGMSWVASG